MSYQRNKSIQKQSLEPRTHYRSKQEASISERLTYLENAVHKLQYQQEQLAPLLSLTDNVSSLAKVEITSKQIAQKYRDIEECIKLYDEQIKQIRKQSQGLVNKSKTSLKDETTSRENDGKALKNHIIDVQNTVKQVDLENQMEVKNLQVSTKEEIIQVVENFDNKILSMKDDYASQISDNATQINEKQNENIQNIQQYQETYNNFKQHAEQSLAIINGNITPKVADHITFTSDNLVQFQDMLIKDLEQTIDAAVNQDKTETLKKQKQFHLKINQEFLSLRGVVENIHGVFEEKFKGQMKESISSQPLDQKLNSLNQEVRQKIDMLKQNSEIQDNELQEKIDQIEELVDQFQQLDKSTPEDIQEAIQKIKNQINHSAQLLENQSIKNQSDLYKLQEQQKLVEEIRTQLTKSQANETFEKKSFIQKEGDVTAQQGQEIVGLKKQLNMKSGDTQNNIQELNSSFDQVLKNAEKKLGIKLTDGKQAPLFKSSFYGSSDKKQFFVKK